jgi:hypothetical protein
MAVADDLLVIGVAAVPGPLAHFSRLVALEHLQLWVAEPEASISLAFTDVMSDADAAHARRSFLRRP